MIMSFHSNSEEGEFNHEDNFQKQKKILRIHTKQLRINLLMKVT